MVDAVQPLWLQLCVSLLVLSRIRGQVSAPPHLQALVGLPFTIGCNLTLGPQESLTQVRWEDEKKQPLLMYQPGQAASFISHRVDQTPSQQYYSAITIKRVEPGDKGIYLCKFDVYPTGLRTGTVQLSITARVTMEGNKTAVSGKLAMLFCSYGLPESVQQVLWKKTAEQGDTSNVASFAKRAGATVTEPFRERVSVSHTLGESHLSIKPVRTEDEGCYTCEFNTYPDGSRSATACLTVYVLPKPEVTYRTVSEDVIEANCTALARPAAEIVWNVAGDNKTLGPAVSSSLQQGDGTTLVVSTILIQADLLDDQSVKCLVFHQGLDSPMSVSMNIKIGKALAILISVTTVATILIICMCICLWKCFIRRDD
ncbi:OX-2 membrane glycoprotein [Anguilla rostrata]|uniref:OX-2 membrane glycoprotein n=1 Tax=Anguilla rostrata TaxID=7938 RepID=UPI0030D0ABB0